MTTPFPFTAGQVLTAAQMNDITNLPINDQTASYTLVVGDAGKRVVMDVATANTVTVDDSVFTTGDTIFVANKGAGASTLTAGAGVTINSASGLVLVAHQSGQLVALSASSFLFVLSAGPTPAAGLELISTTTIGTTVSSVTVTGAFSATFDNYKITISGGTCSSTDSTTRLQLGATTTGYFAAFAGGTYAVGASTVLQNNTAFMNVGSQQTDGLNMNIEVGGPFLAKRTYVTGATIFNLSGRLFAGYVNGTTSYTEFTLTSSVGTLTGGEIRVYGYKN